MLTAREFRSLDALESLGLPGLLNAGRGDLCPAFALYDETHQPRKVAVTVQRIAVNPPVQQFCLIIEKL